MRISLKNLLLCFLLAALIVNYVRDLRRQASASTALATARNRLEEVNARLAADFGEGLGDAARDAKSSEDYRKAAIERGWRIYEKVCEKHGHLRIDVEHSAYDDRDQTARRLAYRVHVPATRNLSLVAAVKNLPDVDDAFDDIDQKTIPLAAGARLVEFSWDRELPQHQCELTLSIDGVEAATYTSPLNDFAASFSVPHMRAFTTKEETPPQLVRFLPSKDFASHDYKTPTARLSFVLVEGAE